MNVVWTGRLWVLLTVASSVAALLTLWLRPKNEGQPSPKPISEKPVTPPPVAEAKPIEQQAPTDQIPPNTGHSQARFLLQKTLVLAPAQLMQGHRWVWEGARWNELVFALLAQVSTIAGHELRELVDHMSALDLLNVDVLARIHRGRKEPDYDDVHSRQVQELLTSRGFTPPEAKTGLSVMCEAALGLQDHYGGKIQLYLRHYGEQMLRELSQTFPLSALDNDKVSHAFTYWLQNVSDMPLSIADEHLSVFARNNGLEPKDLVAAADYLDLNVALLDDLALSTAAPQKE